MNLDRRGLLRLLPLPVAAALPALPAPVAAESYRPVPAILYDEQGAVLGATWNVNAVIRNGAAIALHATIYAARAGVAQRVEIGGEDFTARALGPFGRTPMIAGDAITFTVGITPGLPRPGDFSVEVYG